MASTALDLTGEQFGRLTATLRGPDAPGRLGQVQWFCSCTCGNERLIRATDLRSGNTKSCGCLNRESSSKRASARNFKGGHGWLNHQGYRLISKPEHPRAYRNGAVLEHILVMENMIGRSLLPGENVHHKNGQRHDNREENLELWSSAQPSGQRISDKVAWAREILALYGHMFPEEAIL